MTTANKHDSYDCTLENSLSLGKSIPKTIIQLSIPSIIEQFLICLATLADTAMVGSIGAAATASVAISTSTIWLINGIITALSVGASYLVSHAIGEGDRDKTESSVRQSLTASILVGLCLTILVMIIYKPLPRWLGAEPEVIPNAQIYFQIIGFGLIPQTISVVLSAILRSAGNTKLPLYCNLGSNMLNVIGNFFLIYPSRSMTLPFAGDLSLPVWGADLGIRGAAIATTGSRYALALILFYHIVNTQTAARISLSGNYRFRRETVRSLVHISIPVMLERNTLCLGQIALTAMISGLGTVPLAAHYLTNQTEGLLYLPAYGFAYTATTLIGQSLGAQDKELAERFARDICIISTIAIILACIPVYLFAGAIISLFTNDAQVLHLGTMTLKIAAATEIFFSFFIVASGIFRGSGDVKFPLVVSLTGMWGFRIGLVWMVVYVLKWGVVGVWIAIAFDCFIRTLLCLWRLLSRKWMECSV